MGPDFSPTMYANARQELFCREFVANGFDAAKAYIAVYNPPNPKYAGSVAKGMMTRQKIKDRIAELKKDVEQEIVFDAAKVLREWVLIATADPGEISKVRHCNCRYCWGVDGKYQWKNEREFAIAMGNYLSVPEGKRSGNPPKDEGGYGYRDAAPPRAECTECGGEGTTDLWLAATDDLSPQARKLYAGAKITKNGIEVMTRNQDDALRNIARFYGMLTRENDPKTGAVVVGDGQAQGTPPALPVDAVEASRVYADWMKNSG